jgi:CMD domain protein
MDLLDTLLRVQPGSAMDRIRARRTIARKHTQESYRVLFTPEEPGGFTPDERFAVGAYVSALHGESPLAAHYAAELAQRAPALAPVVATAAQGTQADGPHGAYPSGPLSVENTPAPAFTLQADVAAALGPRLATAFAHAHFLVFHPRDAAPERFAPLLAAGWTTPEIVTLSQMVSFLAYQLRAAHGLAVLARHVGDAA